MTTDRRRPPLGRCVARRAGVEPPSGRPDGPPVVEALSELDAEPFVVAGHDMCRVDGDLPLPIATRTRQCLTTVGLHSR